MGKDRVRYYLQIMWQNANVCMIVMAIPIHHQTKKDAMWELDHVVMLVVRFAVIEIV
ncbi:hypothetical protein CRYUN_Cryun25bG0038400 [Craigia yunnanensis]